MNERMPHRIVRRLAELVEPERGHKIALLGAAYKADVDDARESPTVHIDALLRERGYATAIYDPLVKQFHRPLCASLDEAVGGADAIVFVTPHAAFRSIRPAAMASLMRTPRMIDTRTLLRRLRVGGVRLRVLPTGASVAASRRSGGRVSGACAGWHWGSR